MKRAIAPLIVAALTFGATCSHALAATQADVFNAGCVSKIQLSASPTAIANLTADPKGAYQPATMTFDVCGTGTNVVGPVAVTFRLKGSGSFESLAGKAAFKIKMPSASRIDGLKSLTLNNMNQDPSAIHEALAYDAFRGVGLAAPRTGYATVRINDADYGLHANIESLDDRFIAAHFASMQHLYEQPDWTAGWTQFSDRDIFPAAVPNFQLQEGSASSRSDLESLAQVSTIADDADWWAAFQQHFVATDALKFWAVEFYLGDHDNYVNWVNNYELNSTADGVFNYLPWGTDGSFTDPVPLFGYDSASPIVTRCLNFAPCRAAYRSALGEVAEKIIGLDLVSKAHQLDAAIKSAVSADTRMHATPAQQCFAANATIDFLIAREALWSSTFRSPASDITSAQSSTQIDCGSPGAADETPADPLPEPATAPATAIDSSAPQLTRVSVRRLLSHERLPGGRLAYRLTIVAVDAESPVDSIQIRTFGRHIHSKPVGGAFISVEVETAAARSQVRAIDASGNVSKWKSVAMPR